MKITKFGLALLASSALTFAGAAQAQDAPAADLPPESEADVLVQPESPQTNEELAARAAFLEAQIEAMQDQINELKGQMTKATPTWSGAPRLEDKDAGWQFKVRGRVQYDAGYVENPGDGIVTRNLGFNARARRIRLGVEGTIPGGFGYKAEMDFANATTGFGDVIITYTPKDKPWSVTIGNHETMNGLEQITSSRFISFLERSQFNDAFVNTRRIGLSVGLQDKANILRFAAGIFAAHSIDASLDNEGWIGAARATYSPQALGGQLHFGASYQHRVFQSNNGGTASTSAGSPSTNQLARYRARPFLQTTDVRFVDTTAFAAKSDDIIGVEAAGIFKSLHVTGEAQWLKANAYEAGDIETGLDAFSAANTALVPSGDPSFFGFYAEAGYFLTGETRGFRNGLWDRTKVLKPFSQGGWGAFQVNARYDYLDLDDSDLQNGFTNNFTTGVATASNNLGRGGTQEGFLASLIWIPEDWMRFLFQAGHVRVRGGPSAGVVDSTSTEPLNERNYSSNQFAVRAQIDW
jgi:phosphate-selective porin OprO and OprP